MSNSHLANGGDGTIESELLHATKDFVGIPDSEWRAVRAKWCRDIGVFNRMSPLADDIVGQMILAGHLYPQNPVHLYALFRHTRSRPYLKLLAKGGCRFNLNGNPAKHTIGKYTQETAAMMVQGVIPRLARSHEVKWGQNSLQDEGAKELSLLQIQAGALKVRLVVTDFEKYCEIETVGVREIDVVFETVSGQVKAKLKAKSFRKAQSHFTDLHGNAQVTISGGLDMASGEILEPLISVSARSAAYQRHDSKHLVAAS